MNTRSTPIRFTLELDGDIILQQVRLHPRSGSKTINGSRKKVGIIGDLQPGLNSKNIKVEIISTGKPVAQLNHTTRCDSDSSVSHLFMLLFFACRQLSIPRQSTGCEQNTLSHCMYKRGHCVHTAHCTDLFHAHAWLKLCLP